MSPNGHRRAWLLVTAALVGAVLLVLASPGLRMQLAKSTSQRPTPFTELYFANSTDLPKRVVAGVPSQFQFVIANHEGKAVTYSYLVTAQDAGSTTTVTSSAVTIADGQALPSSVSFVPSRPNETYLISVELLHRPETIRFRATSS